MALLNIHKAGMCYLNEEEYDVFFPANRGLGPNTGEKIIRVFGLLNYPWLRSESRINTDLFPLGNFLEIDSPKSLFLGFWVIQTSLFPDFNLKSFFLIKNLFIIRKIWPISVKRWKAV